MIKVEPDIEQDCCGACLLNHSCLLSPNTDEIFMTIVTFLYRDINPECSLLFCSLLKEYLDRKYAKFHFLSGLIIISVYTYK